MEAKDKSSQGPVLLIVWRGFFHIEVVAGDIGVEEVDGIKDGRRIPDGSAILQEA